MIHSQTFTPSPGKSRSLYLHIPFCRNRCGYCNFTLVAGRDDLIQRYLAAITTEISWLQDRHTVSTVFLGGGTPSHLTPDQIQQLGSAIRSRFDIEGDCEFTAECNPNDLDASKAAALAELGVNRISLGVQSFDPQKLSTLERTHSRSDIETAMKVAREFARSVSVDLIFGAHGETAEQWTRDLESAIKLAPDHISTYELTYEKGTAFWSRLNRGELASAAEDLRCEMYETAIKMLGGAELEHYEVSSFARAGHRCRHNQSYWNGNDYFAFGPGASRFVDGVRETNHRSTTTYIKRIEANRSPIDQQQKLSPRQIAFDNLVFGLRQRDGIRLDDFEESTGFNALDLMGPNQKLLQQHGLIEIDSTVCRLTHSGLLVADAIATKIYETNKE